MLLTARRTPLLSLLWLMMLMSFYGIKDGCGQDSEVSDGVYFDGEPFLTINPGNPQHLVVAWMGLEGLDLVQINVRVSFDGGTTWGPAAVLEHIATFYTMADPSMAWDAEGNLYLCYIDYHNAAISGKILMRKSVDGGLSWGEPIEVLDYNADPGEVPVDRPWMSIDRSGGPLSGTIYVTSKPAPWEPFPNRNYLTVSSDGSSFGPWRYIDTIGWQIGAFIQAPMAAPVVGSDGVFHCVYPAWEWTENLLPRFVNAASANGGASLSYAEVAESSGDDLNSDTLAKTGYQLISDPLDADHLALLTIMRPLGDNDVYMYESFDGGNNWGDRQRINDDPGGTGVMQDLVWADFDSDGDLAVSWRDRRNAADTGYAVHTEIWAAVRQQGAVSFGTNFKISSASAAFDSVLLGNGNDFMSLQFEQDTLYATWGDARDGILTIWFNKQYAYEGGAGMQQLLSAETNLKLTINPNPATDQFNIVGNPCSHYYAVNNLGEQLSLNSAGIPGTFDTSNLSEGTWFICGEQEGKTYTGKLVVIHK